MHRIAVIGAGPLDILPHNGAVITLLAVCGCTHRESYLDIVIVAIVSSLLALAAVILLGGQPGRILLSSRGTQQRRASASCVWVAAGNAQSGRVRHVSKPILCGFRPLDGVTSASLRNSPASPVLLTARHC
jgi:hypothetical protein